MKRQLIAVVSLLLILGACATVPRSPISTDDLASFKGTWEGWRDMQFDDEQFFDYAELEVHNDSLPLKGEITINFMRGSDVRTYPFEKGQIDPEGNLVLPLTDRIKTVLSLYKEKGKMKLGGSYYHNQNEGKLVLHKKQK